MKRAIFDLNSQHDIIPDDKTLIETIQFIIINAIENDINVIGSIIEGEPKYKETLCVDETNIYEVPNLGHGIDMNLANDCEQIYFITKNYMKEQSDNINTYLRTNNIDTVTIVGGDYKASFRELVDLLKQSLYHIEVISDAIDVKNKYLSGLNVMSAEEFIEKINN